LAYKADQQTAHQLRPNVQVMQLLTTINAIKSSQYCPI